MSTSQAQIKAVRKWEKENYWKATVQLPKDYEQKIKSSGKSINGFLREAIDFYLENHKE
jgi:hypothetical protein